ncbi:hypothetical protein [Actinomadura chokoriensis]|uniref:DUF5709 domain-containing protein n=1 Tax=Actinomadura chokoriensis TaxID=454156 RepID=A0ABV4R237_9ACTN
MTDRDRFRGQDPDNEFSQDDYPTEDEMSSSMGGQDEWSRSMRQDQGGRASDAESEYTYEQGGYFGQDETSSNMHGDGMRGHRPDRKPGSFDEDDEFGDEEIGGW